MPQAINSFKLLIKSLGYTVCFHHSCLSICSVSPNNNILPEVFPLQRPWKCVCPHNFWEKELIVNFLGDCVLQVRAFTQAVTELLV